MSETWACEAYGGGGSASVGTMCFRSNSSERVCKSFAECQTFMAGERQRIFRRVNELAASGDSTFEQVEGEFASPDDFLGGGQQKP